MEKQAFLNTYINNIGMDEAIQSIETMVEKKIKSYIVPINVDVVVKIEDDPYLKEIIDNANLVLVDGKPLVWISGWHVHPVKEKVSGSDLIPCLCREAVRNGYSIFIIGGKEGVAEMARQNLEKLYPGINIIGTYAPPFGFEKDAVELERINKRISETHPDLLIVCFGCPKQEKWIYENYRNYDATVSICAGATVDFIAGNIKRAPKWMSNHGLEWVYRITREPKRLAKRYLVDDMRILGIAKKYWRVQSGRSSYGRGRKKEII